MTPARKQKPTSADEVARVLRIFDILGDELNRRWQPVVIISDVLPVPNYGPRWDLLTIADRIASRTED